MCPLNGDAKIRTSKRRAADRLRRLELSTNNETLPPERPKPFRSTKKPLVFALVALLLVTVGAIATLARPKTVYVLSIGDLVLGTIENPEMKDQALQLLLEEEAARVGVDIGVETDIAVAEAKDDGTLPVLTGEQVTQAFREHLTYVSTGYVINVDGQDVVALSSEEDARGAISDLRADYICKYIEARNATVDEVLINEAIDFEQKSVATDSIRSREEAVAILARGSDKTLCYTVQRGDSLWAIAEANHLTVDSLRKANPEVRTDLLQIGQELSLVVPDPFVTLSSRETIVFTVNIPYSLSVEEDPEKWPWEETVIQAGQSGQKEVTQIIRREDGEEVSRSTLSEKILSYPVTKKIRRGSKLVPTMGSGEMAWPLQGTITSRFGPRWGSFHYGVDIGADHGSNIFAADSGMVASAGWNGGYGNLVKIDHGDGKQTWYAHLSDFNVQVGASVNKGDVIGYVGSTGVSTGPHLHFEVRIDGVAKDPLTFYE